MKKLLFIICLLSISLFARNDKIGTPRFLDIQVDDYAAQSDIDRLKQEFLSRSRDIHTAYENRIDRMIGGKEVLKGYEKERISKLKAQKKDDLRNLKKEFKRKLRTLKERHPKVKFPKKRKKPDTLDSPEVRPEHKTKPMRKEDADRRRELNNPNNSDVRKKNRKNKKEAISKRRELKNPSNGDIHKKKNRKEDKKDLKVTKEKPQEVKK